MFKNKTAKMLNKAVKSCDRNIKKSLDDYTSKNERGKVEIHTEIDEKDTITGFSISWNSSGKNVSAEEAKQFIFKMQEALNKMKKLNSKIGQKMDY